MKNRVVFDYHSKWFRLAGVSLLAGVLFPSLLAFATANVLVCVYVSRRIERSYFNSGVSSFVFGLCLAILTTSLLTTVAWATKVPIAVSIIAPLSLGVLLALAALLTPRATTLTRKNIIDTKDILALGSVLVFCCIVGVGIVRSHETRLKLDSFLLINTANGIDDLSHLGMFSDTIRVNRGLLLGSRDADNVSKKDNITYPKMSHVVAASFADATNDTFLPKTIAGKQGPYTQIELLRMYAITKILFFGLILYVIARVAAELYSHSKLNASEIISGLIPVQLIYFLFVVPFIQEGFYSIWPIMLFFPLLLLVIRQFVTEKSISNIHLLLYALTAQLFMMTWPIYGLVLYALAAGMCVVYVKPILVHLQKGKPGYIFSSAIVFLVGLAQLYEQFFDTKGISTSKINEPGGIMPFEKLIVPILLVLVFCYLRTNVAQKDNASRKQHAMFNLILLMLLCVSTGITIAIGMSNIMASGDVQYFYVKTFYILALVMAVIAVPAIMKYANTFAHQDDAIVGSLQPIMISGLACSLVLFPLYQASPFIPYVGGYALGGNRKITVQNAEIAKKLLTENDSNSGSSLFIDVDNKHESYYLTTLFRMVDGFNYCTGAIESMVIQNLNSADLSLCTTNKPITVYVIDDSAKPNQIDLATISKSTDFVMSHSSNVSVKIKHL